MVIHWNGGEWKRYRKKCTRPSSRRSRSKRVSSGERIAHMRGLYSLSTQTLRNWIKAAALGKLRATGSQAVTPEAMALSRLRAEVIRLRRENRNNKTHDKMKAAAFEYIEVFYHRVRQHFTLGYHSPVQYLDRWRTMQNSTKY